MKLSTSAVRMSIGAVVLSLTSIYLSYKTKELQKETEELLRITEQINQKKDEKLTKDQEDGKAPLYEVLIWNVGGVSVIRPVYRAPAPRLIPFLKLPKEVLKKKE